MKFSEKVGNRPVNKRFNFGRNPDHRLDTGIVYRIRHYCEIRKWLTDINLLPILIRQMAALVKRALLEVCTVPMLPVLL